MIYVAPMRAAVIYCVDHLQRFDVAAVEHAAGTSHVSAVVYMRQLTRLAVVAEESEIYSAGPRFAPWAAHIPRTRPRLPQPDSRIYDKSRRQLLGMQVRKMLETLGKSYSWLANEVGVAKPFISYIIHCQRPASQETMERIIRALEEEYGRQNRARDHADPGSIPAGTLEGAGGPLQGAETLVRA